MEDNASVRRNAAELRLTWQWLVTALAMQCVPIISHMAKRCL